MNSTELRSYGNYDMTSATVLPATIVPSPTTTTAYEITPCLEHTAAAYTGQIGYVVDDSTGEAVMEIRRRSGLTWEELSYLFSVSRRSVHHWASGKRVSARHDRMIRRTLETIRHLDRGEQRKTRALLLSVDENLKITILDLLKKGDYDGAASGVESINNPYLFHSQLSPAAWKARQPQSPILLLGAKQERHDTVAEKVHRQSRVTIQD